MKYTWLKAQSKPRIYDSSWYITFTCCLFLVLARHARLWFCTAMENATVQYVHLTLHPVLLTDLTQEMVPPCAHFASEHSLWRSAYPRPLCRWRRRDIGADGFANIAIARLLSAQESYSLNFRDRLSHNRCATLVALSHPWTAAISVIAQTHPVVWQHHHAAVHCYVFCSFHRVCYHMPKWNCKPGGISANSRTSGTSCFLQNANHPSAIAQKSRFGREAIPLTQEEIRRITVHLVSNGVRWMRTSGTKLSVCTVIHQGNADVICVQNCRLWRDIFVVFLCNST